MNEYEHVVPVEYRDEMYDCTAEGRWAAYFDLAGIPFEYHPETFDFGGRFIYTPDFFLPDQEMYVEIKKNKDLYQGSSNVQRLGSRLGVATALVDGDPRHCTWYLYSPDPDMPEMQGGRSIQASFKYDEPLNPNLRFNSKDIFLEVPKHLKNISEYVRDSEFLPSDQVSSYAKEKHRQDKYERRKNRRKV